MNTRRSRDKDLLFDSEIERTARLNRKASTTRTFTDSSSIVPPSSPPSPGLGALLDPSPSLHSETDAEEDLDQFIDIMANDQKPLKSSFVPQGVAQPSCITFTPADGTSFSLSPQLINSVPHFYGKPNEDPNSHLREFYDLCRTQFPPGLTAEQLKLILFPFSLKDHAKWWLNSLPADTIATWEQLSTKFITKFFPAQRTRQLRRDIHTFRQKQGDLFCEA